MFYVLARLTNWLAHPLFYVAVLCIIAFIVKRRWAKITCATLAALLALIMSVPAVYWQAADAWVPNDASIVYVDSTRHYDYCLLPGGMTNYDSISGRVEYGEAAERIIDAVGLLKTGIVDTLIISGDGAANIAPEVFKMHMERTYGVPSSQLIFETEAKTTYENFSCVARQVGLDNLSGHTLVINSGMYMRRTLLCARLINLDADFYVVDFPYSHRPSWSNYLPSPYTYDQWLRLIHELIGYAAYKAIHAQN